MSANPYDFYRYLPVSRSDRDWGLYVTAGGSQTLGEGAERDRHPPGYEYHWSKGRIFADEFSVLCVAEGAPFEFESEATGRQLVRVGDLFLLFPGVWHRYRCTRDVRNVHLWATFAGSHARQLQRRKLIDPLRPVLAVNAHEGVMAPYRRLLNLLGTGGLGLPQKLAGCILDILGSARAVDRAEPASDTFADAIQQAIVFLEEHVDEEIDLEKLADTWHLSYDQFRHVFKERTGLAPYQYHLQLRIGRARELLLGTNLSVKQIAYTLRFASPYHFSKIFKKKTGMSPQQWRERTRRPETR